MSLLPAAVAEGLLGGIDVTVDFFIYGTCRCYERSLRYCNFYLIMLKVIIKLYLGRIGG
jgi:hypothetical protein